MTCAVPKVGTIVQDLCAMVGITSVDTSAIDNIDCRGFIAGGAYTAANTIRTLQRTYLFDLPEIDGELVAVLRGGGAIAIISRAEMVEGHEAKFESAREQGVEFPKKLSISYQNAESDYTPTKQTSERRSDDIRSKSEVTVQVPINLTDDQAVQAADKMHKIAWAEQQGTVKFAVSEIFAYITPADIVYVESYNGVFKRVRIQKSTFVDGFIQFEAVIDRAAGYASTLIAPTPTDPVQPGTNLPGGTTYEVMDLPVLLQSQDTLHVYVAATGLTDIWAGAVVEQLLDTEWIERARVTYPSTMGITADTLASHAAGIDITNTILVTVSDDDIASVTQAEFDAGANLFLIEDELIQARDVVAEGTDYRLSYLNRGALNTSTASHASGVRCVMLTSPTVVLMTSGEIGQSITFRCYTVGTLPTVADETTFTFNGYSQYEWTPLYATIGLNGSDWELSWDHNKRIGAPNNAVISQNFLNFAIVFTSGASHHTVFTTSETLTYTEAEQIADFGAAITSWDLVQIYGNNRFTGYGLPPATPVTITGDSLLLEGGSFFLLEDGSGSLLLEV